MLERSHVREVKNIVPPRKALWIERAAHDESFLRPAPRGFQKKRVYSFLTVVGVRSQIGQIRDVFQYRCRRTVKPRIDAAVERGDVTRAKMRLEFRQCESARVTQHEIEIAES